LRMTHFSHAYVQASTQNPKPKPQRIS